MKTKKLFKASNSIRVTLPKSFLKILNLDINDKVNIECVDNKIIIRKGDYINEIL